MIETLFVFLIFLCLGSFLNVVIYRYPKEMSLFLPRSFCPFCHQKLHWYHNIPLFSFIFLKGKCSFCHKKISYRYLLVELLTGMVGIILFFRFGMNFNVYFLGASLFSLILIVLIFIDLEYQILPDIFTLGLLWLGLMISVAHLFVWSRDAIIGAAAGYLSLWCVAKIYEQFAHVEGMGHGDFKLLAALGAWTGWQYLLPTVLIASLLGLMVGVYYIVKYKADARTPLAFGPYLAISGWIMLLFPTILKYLNLSI